MRGSERFAALRIGWVLSPECLVRDLTLAKLDADRGSPGIDQLALSEFIRCGHLDRHLRRTRLIYMAAGERCWRSRYLSSRSSTSRDICLRAEQLSSAP